MKTRVFRQSVKAHSKIHHHFNNYNVLLRLEVQMVFLDEFEANVSKLFASLQSYPTQASEHPENSPVLNMIFRNPFQIFNF